MMENLFHVMELKVLFAKGHVVTLTSLMIGNLMSTIMMVKAKNFLSSSTP